MRCTTWTLVALSLLASGTHAQPQGDFCEVRYELLELGALGSFARSSASAVSNRGHVTGNTTSGEFGSTAFLWSCSSGMQDVGVASGLPDTAGISLNERDEVIMYASAQYPDLTPTAWYWDRTRGAIVLDPTKSFFPHTITNAGVVTDGVQLWTANGGLRPLNVGVPTFDARLTNFGRLSGTTPGDDEFSLRLFTWTRRQGARDLGPVPSGFVVTSDINDRGDLLVEAYELRTAFIVDPDGDIELLPREGDVFSVSAVALNMQREVVGFRLIVPTGTPRSSRTFIWDTVRGYRDLDEIFYGTTTGHSRFIPTSINDWGWIAGNSDGLATLAIPVPAHSSRYQNLQQLRGGQLCRAFNEIKLQRLICTLKK